MAESASASADSAQASEKHEGNNESSGAPRREGDGVPVRFVVVHDAQGESRRDATVCLSSTISQVTQDHLQDFLEQGCSVRLFLHGRPLENHQPLSHYLPSTSPMPTTEAETSSTDTIRQRTTTRAEQPPSAASDDGTGAACEPPPPPQQQPQVVNIHVSVTRRTVASGDGSTELPPEEEDFWSYLLYGCVGVILAVAWDWKWKHPSHFDSFSSLCVYVFTAIWGYMVLSTVSRVCGGLGCALLRAVRGERRTEAQGEAEAQTQTAGEGAVDAAADGGEGERTAAGD
ncbi:unnamed protein product [Vitrella brassicaformis CCMP3155]|uniref:Ubiquitin-like domain-containing protein n=2 Tax=Vitrella brassicaformis TaxID=1169539 RepID=A0A0G4H3W3_VITBC|nr:unnamed protein product [Vitrella brassicaformis CCMP3155]|eukprot:CEM38390.1 unnamed protein product [Vitrella brassicaformis CCMP3155]